MIVEDGRYWLIAARGRAPARDIILIRKSPRAGQRLDCVFARSSHGKRFSIIVAAEGARPRGGQMVVSKRIAGSPEPIRLGGIGARLADDIADRTGLDCRAVILGHVQRGGTPTPYDRVLATNHTMPWSC
jgi:6-phosphofructokinase 1